MPSKVISIRDMMATIEAYGARKDVSLLLMPETVEVNDYVLVHAGFAIQKVDKAAAEDALVLIKQIVDELEKEGDEY
ncbi:MAG: HypC/HybG/HupF family hydrogenase formation chaperone [Thermodesulfovibrionales bacterium]